MTLHRFRPTHGRGSKRSSSAMATSTADDQRHRPTTDLRPRTQILRRLEVLYPIATDDLPPAFSTLLKEIARRLG